MPIIILKSICDSKYIFKVSKNAKNLKKTKTYEASYKLIKFCTDDVWNSINK